MTEKELNRLRKKAWKNRNRRVFSFQLPLGPSPYDLIASMHAPVNDGVEDLTLAYISKWYDEMFGKEGT